MFGLIDHVGVAVDDLDAALALYEGTFGMPVAHRETVDRAGRRGGAARRRRLPRRAAAPARARRRPVGKFLERKGPGLHHVAYRVDDIEAVAGRSSRDEGVALIDSEPRTGIRNSRVAFLHPRSTGSVLTEIVEPAKGH